MGFFKQIFFPFCGGKWTLDHPQSWLQVVTDESRRVLEPHYFRDMLEPVLELGISIAFPQNIATLGHFPQKIHLCNLQPTLFFLSPSGENSSQKNSSGWRSKYLSNSFCIQFT
jgi:hypothetical protein